MISNLGKHMVGSWASLYSLVLQVECKRLMKKAEKFPSKQFFVKTLGFWPKHLCGKHLLSQENEGGNTWNMEPVIPKPSYGAAEQR